MLLLGGEKSGEIGEIDGEFFLESSVEAGFGKFIFEKHTIRI